MLESVDVGGNADCDYEVAAGCEGVERSRTLTEPLRRARIPHLNAAPYNRGGVVGPPRSQVPLWWDLEIDADHKIIGGGNKLCTVTKTVHDVSRGSMLDENVFYLTYSTRNARLLEEYGLIFAHGPIPEVHGRGDAKRVRRCHADTSEPQPGPWEYSSPYPGGVTTQAVR